jgi:hypothetical protein
MRSAKNFSKSKSGIDGCIIITFTNLPAKCRRRHPRQDLTAARRHSAVDKTASDIFVAASVCRGVGCTARAYLNRIALALNNRQIHHAADAKNTMAGSPAAAWSFV